MKIDKYLKDSPLTKSNPNTLISLFSQTDIEPFWVADMDFEIAKPIQDSLIQRIQNRSFGYEYKPDSFYEAQKKWYSHKYGIDITRSNIIYSPSISTTIAVVIENSTSQGDGIIIQPPVFMEFGSTIKNTGRQIIKNPLKLIDGQYLINFQDLEEKAASHSNKVLIICNPHNPVGRVWTKDELLQIVNICKRNNLILISDEIHKDIILFENRFTSALEFIEEYDKIIVCTSEAKTFNLCGISDSMALIPNEEITIALTQSFRKYNLGRTNALTRIALESAYNNGEPWLKALLKTIEINIDSIENALIDSEVNLIKPEGTYQVWLDFRGIYKDSKEMFGDIIEKTGLGLNAGHWFGREGALFMRMNIATSTEKVTDAIERITKAVLEDK